MKFASTLVIGSALVFQFAQAASNDKFKIPSHDHQHAADCGHPAITHGDHQDYLHDGSFHAAHSGHYDHHGAEKVKSKGRESASESHQKAKAHDHKHENACGHEAVKHGDHEDYLHDGQYHAKHGSHYDLHGAPLTH